MGDLLPHIGESLIAGNNVFLPGVSALIPVGSLQSWRSDQTERLFFFVKCDHKNRELCSFGRGFIIGRV
jgi:hypothetical protein